MIEKIPCYLGLDQPGDDFIAAGPRDLDQAESLMEEALLAGAEEAEVYLKSSRTTGVFLQSGFATLSGGNERGVALRVFDGEGRWGHAHASWGEPSLNRRLVREALAVLKNQSGESTGVLAPAPRPSSPFPSVDGVVDSRVLHGEPVRKRETLEAALRGIWGDSLPPLAIALREGISRVAMVNSRGLKACFHRTLALLTLTLSHGGGSNLVAEHVGCGIGGEEIAATAEEILRLREAQEGEEEIAPRGILLKSTAAPVLMRWLQHEILTGEPLAGAGRIASEAIDLVDDPLLPGGVASTPFDGEGYPSRRQTLLKSGFLLAAPEENPGSGPGGGSQSVRPSYRDVPAPGATNVLVLPGRRAGSELIEGMESGVVLAALDYEAGGAGPAREARWRGIGWEVRDGQVAGECRRFLFLAAPRQLLNGVVEVSSGLRFSLHRSTALGCGELLIHPRP